MASLNSPSTSTTKHKLKTAVSHSYFPVRLLFDLKLAPFLFQLLTSTNCFQRAGCGLLIFDILIACGYSLLKMDTDFQVLVVQTGGTIDKDYPRTTGQYAFEIGESAALKILNQSFAPVTFRVTSLSVCRKDSQVRTYQ